MAGERSEKGRDAIAKGDPEIVKLVYYRIRRKRGASITQNIRMLYLLFDEEPLVDSKSHSRK